MSSKKVEEKEKNYHFAYERSHARFSGMALLCVWVGDSEVFFDGEIVGQVVELAVGSRCLRRIGRLCGCFWRAAVLSV